MFFIWICLLALHRVEGEDVRRNCSTSVHIQDGHVSFSQGGEEGSVLKYHCRPGQYPFPVSSRTCGANGRWSAMRLNNGRPLASATCRDVTCPAQLQLDHGHFWPQSLWFRVGSVQSFSCETGFTLTGSDQRNCTVSGAWTGTAPVCRDNDAGGDCDDPGAPPGALMQRPSAQFLLGDRVSYRCHSGLELLGSEQRQCLQQRDWSGPAPRCHSSYMFDSPSAVAAAMTGSLAGVMDVLTPDSVKKAHFGRTITTSEGSRLNVFILLDTSGSITKEDFEFSRTATISLIRKLESYEVQIRYHVLSFATEVIDVVDILNVHTSAYAERVVDVLQSFDPNRHGTKIGTNLFAALSHVNRRLAALKKHKDHFNETQNVIVIETDGFSNVGNKSSLAMKLIRSTLGYNHTSIDHTHERLLDVYVFGIGSTVKKDELNSLASRKQDETHLFILKDFRDLRKVFNDIISDKTVTVCGVAQEEVEDDSRFHTHPWHVTVLTNGSKPQPCSGSIVSPRFVLTAAHCFGRKGSEQVFQKVTVDHGGGSVTSKRVIMHPHYNVDGLKQRNVKEFYDYDVALIELETPIPLSWRARPICLPCTVSASRALKSINSTCEQHRNALIPQTRTTVSFLHRKFLKTFERKETHVHTGDQRWSCVEAARQTLSPDADVTLEEVVPETMLCSGGTTNKQDAITCKGDSGGSLFLEKRKRYFQVGVVSWGTHSCSSYASPPSDARDFHIDVFGISSWLKSHLKQELRFLPDVY